MVGKCAIQFGPYATIGAALGGLTVVLIVRCFLPQWTMLMPSLPRNPADSHYPSYAAFSKAAAEGRWPTFDEAWSCTNCPHVMQQEAEARLMVSQMTAGRVVLEYGSGDSTFFLPLFGVNLHSVEHFRPWYEYVRGHLARSPRGDTVKYVHVAANNPENLGLVWQEPSQYAWYKDYIRSGRRWAKKGQHFDLVFVDGRARPQAAVEALFLADPARLEHFRMLLHDVYPLGEEGGMRDHYLMVENFYDRLEEAQTMTLWQPKSDALQLAEDFTDWPDWWCGADVRPDARCTELD